MVFDINGLCDVVVCDVSGSYDIAICNIGNWIVGNLGMFSSPKRHQLVWCLSLWHQRFVWYRGLCYVVLHNVGNWIFGQFGMFYLSKNAAVHVTLWFVMLQIHVTWWFVWRHGPSYRQLDFLAIWKIFAKKFSDWHVTSRFMTSQVCVTPQFVWCHGSCDVMVHVMSQFVWCRGACDVHQSSSLLSYHHQTYIHHLGQPQNRGLQHLWMQYSR